MSGAADGDDAEVDQFRHAPGQEDVDRLHVPVERAFLVSVSQGRSAGHDVVDGVSPWERATVADQILQGALDDQLIIRNGEPVEVYPARKSVIALG